ncbi:MAG: serine hydroxymethyltransferase [Dethiobacter sp.]|nr:serine hydroxymethyltransferase [Dethiobacter sp.]
MNALRCADPEIALAIEAEQRRQQTHLELIASENLVSRAVLQAQGSILTNKYAEGYPAARYYGGCKHADTVEDLARSRAINLFGADHANVQPHSGASANLAVYLACLDPGDRILGMDLAHGGHLTHGAAVSISGRYFQAHSYGVDHDTGLINLEEVRTRAQAVKPKLIVAGASSYPRKIDYPGFQGIARETGALFMADIAHVAGLIVAGLHANPVHYADLVTSTTHKTLRGPRGGFILCRHEFAKSIDRAVFPGLQGGPLMHIIAAKAVAFKEALSPDFAIYQQRVLDNAEEMAKHLEEYGFNLVTGGTDTHLVLVDLRSKGITGLEAERLLERVGITANKNAIPYDPQSRQVTSGLRLGTPVITSRGMGRQQIKQIAGFIRDAITGRQDPGKLVRIREQVARLCLEFPIC